MQCYKLNDSIFILRGTAVKLEYSCRTKRFGVCLLHGCQHRKITAVKPRRPSEFPDYLDSVVPQKYLLYELPCNSAPVLYRHVAELRKQWENVLICKRLRSAGGVLSDFSFDAFALLYQALQLFFEYLSDGGGGLCDAFDEVVYLRGDRLKPHFHLVYGGALHRLILFDDNIPYLLEFPKELLPDRLLDVVYPGSSLQASADLLVCLSRAVEAVLVDDPQSVAAVPAFFSPVSRERVPVFPFLN